LLARRARSGGSPPTASGTPLLPTSLPRKSRFPLRLAQNHGSYLGVIYNSRRKEAALTCSCLVVSSKFQASMTGPWLGECTPSTTLESINVFFPIYFCAIFAPHLELWCNDC
jgi:hypothetical protein